MGARIATKRPMVRVAGGAQGVTMRFSNPPLGLIIATAVLFYVVVHLVHAGLDGESPFVSHSPESQLTEPDQKP